MAEVKTLYDCFFIAKAGSEHPTNSFIFPQDYEDPTIKQLLLFCFPFDSTSSISSSIVQRNQHFTFMLTDLEKRHRYGFCKLVDGSKSCYCFISNLPWFEVFYKLLNCMFELNVKNDLQSMAELLLKLYETPMPKPLQVIQISTSLTFTSPLETARPSIPENRNLMEYYSACSPKMMMQIFAALMHERRVIITCSSLSILAGCVFSAEALLYPLNWQHIYIPILPPHVLDYCTAPIPYVIGIHSSLMTSVRQKIHGDDCGIVIVNVDDKKIETPFHDLERIPSDVSSYLKSQLNKPNIAVGTQLATAFLKTQARLIGGYRNALKIDNNGKSVVFDQELFVESQYLKQKKIFAEEMRNLQTFKEFIDKRVALLNGGVGFRDDFEAEVNRLQENEGTTQQKVYKDWMQVKEKGGELITTMKKHANKNYKVARQSMIETTSKSSETAPRRTSLTKRQSLRENIKSMRPPRPAPPKPRRQAPPRPPPPSSSSVRKYKVIEFEDEEIEDCEAIEEARREDEESLQEDSNEEQPSNLLIDFSELSSENTSLNSQEYSNSNTLNEMDLLSLIDAELPPEYSPPFETTLLQPTQVTIRAAYQVSRDKVLSPNGEFDPVDLFGFSWPHENNVSSSSTEQHPQSKTSAGKDLFSFDNFNSMGDKLGSQQTENQSTITSSDINDDILLNFEKGEPSSLPPPLLPGL